MYKVLIVDDEFLARKLLQGYVEKIPELELVGCCANIAETYKSLKENLVDLLLLDINLPDLNGMEFAKSYTPMPAVIFTTAYSDYAVQSYEVSAIDYLLKPFSFQRFQEAIGKFIDRQNKPEPVPEDTDFMLVKADYKMYKINYADLLYIEGQHEYVSFYTPQKRITALYALKNLEETLPADRFIRVHKSYIVAISKIKEIQQNTIRIADASIPIGGSYREALLKRLGIS